MSQSHPQGQSLMPRLASFLALMAACCMVEAPAVAQKSCKDAAWWPQFRGPNSLGVSLEEKKLPIHFGPEKNVFWKTPLPAGHSSPCVWDDRIFVTGFDKAAQKLEILCVDRRKGQVLWRRTIPAQTTEKVHEFNSPAVATPATDGERVYVSFGAYGLLCYDFEGNEKWKKQFPLARTAFGTGTSPVVAGDLVLLNRDFQPDP